MMQEVGILSWEREGSQIVKFLVSIFLCNIDIQLLLREYDAIDGDG